MNCCVCEERWDEKECIFFWFGSDFGILFECNENGGYVVLDDGDGDGCEE